MRDLQVSKLTISFIKSKLLNEDEVKKAKYEKLSAPKKGVKQVGTPSDPSKKVAKVKQIDTPKDNAPKEGKGKGSIPQATRASAESKANLKFATGNGGEPKAAKFERLKPSQSTKTSVVRKPSANPDTKNTFGLPQADAASTAGMPRGLPLKSGGVPTVKTPKAASLNGTTAPASKTVTAKLGDKGSKSVKQVSHSGGFMKDPSDAPKKPSFTKVSSSALNLVESGIVVSLNGKTKASFDLVSKKAIERMVENYKKHGYDLEIAKTNDVAWKKDAQLLKSIKESIEAKHNLVMSVHKEAKEAAFKRFSALVGKSFNSLYESKSEFTNNVKIAFDRLMETAESKYVAKLEIFDCMARIVNENNEITDLDIITEAKDHDMALRQIKNKIMEEYGLDTKIQHIFVDGNKYNPVNIKDWTR